MVNLYKKRQEVLKELKTPVYTNDHKRVDLIIFSLFEWVSAMFISKARYNAIKRRKYALEEEVKKLRKERNKYRSCLHILEKRADKVVGIKS